ncbi:hypothetical protein [Pedobacter xixiisoli]|uniref:Uncharacterized protein n=1 Tax=Pedobacter xixiisoli TaxID=1476464 RepID=A0A285ZSG3_9SPHI|nr:hypothetical protein [Pedobacter xixiisoli]SOD12582.1 hypothetical protein SAMN06297358_0743 [Pedobacter xixiisoli]
MSTNSADREMSRLQQDAPVATLPKLSNSEISEHIISEKVKLINDTTQPFFLYPKDGLYGLL